MTACSWVAGQPVGAKNVATAGELAVADIKVVPPNVMFIGL